MPACGFIKASGDACKALPMKGERWCWAHHPEHTEKRKRLGAKGGKRGGRGRPMAELHSVRARLETLVEDVLAGRVDRGDAAVVGQLYNTLIRAISTEMKVREVTELEARLEELEAVMEQSQEGRRGA
jgi:hypothetical protein